MIQCTAVVKRGRIQLVIRKGEKGYSAFANVLRAIEANGCTSWYGDIVNTDGDDQCGLVITDKGKGN